MEVISAHSLLVITNHMALPSGKMFGKCHKFRKKRIRYWEALEGVPYCFIETTLFILKFHNTFLMTHLLILLFSSCIILFQNWDTLRNPFQLLAKVAGILKKKKMQEDTLASVVCTSWNSLKCPFRPLGLTYWLWFGVSGCCGELKVSTFTFRKDTENRNHTSLSMLTAIC